MKSIYLDYAAATPIDGKVLEAMLPYFSEKFFNPSATYLAAKAVRQDVQAARAKVALAVGVRAMEITFTAGGSEANNLAIHGVMHRYSDKKVIVGAIEHESVLAPAHQYHYAEAPVNPDGLVDADRLKGLIDEDTVLVSIMYANNEVGTVQPLREVSSIIRDEIAKRRVHGNSLPLYFHTDAAQATNYLDLHASRLGIDMMTLNGGKIYGPKQSGALWVRSGVDIAPLIYGGGQERGLRSGTENVPGIIGFSKALEIAQTMRHTEAARLQQLQQLFFAVLSGKVPQVVINGSRQRRLPNNVHVTLPGHDNERLLMALDEAGIMAAAGSACSASSEEPSHVLRTMGISEADAQSSLRFTMGRSTTEHDIHATVTALAKAISA